ncbi:MAG TPA: glycogen debranching protein [Clostridiaceae bacterium]|nr:glycogen debranching protein [Clostridiaceae bacterium]
MEFGKADFRTFERGIEKEWLLTNGIGGFACSTIIGANTRRYHGLLIAALRPPVERHLILSKIDESLEVEGKVYNLYSFKTPDYTMNGHYNLQRVTVDPLPLFIYCVEDVTIEKSICMVHGKNTVYVVYRVINGSRRINLRFAPLVNFRDYHHDSRRSHMFFSHKPCDKGVIVKPYNLDIDIRILCSNGEFVSEYDNWFYNMYYSAERERGLSCIEDHYIPGHFKLEVEPWNDIQITIAATVEEGNVEMDRPLCIKKELDRIKELEIKSGFKDDFALKLVRAADSFIVYRKSTDAKTIVAGYPWFTDWGRDAMIAFSGLTLVTGRFDDARQILYTFSKYVKDGLIPNVFPDAVQEPVYNSVDAALWYFEAVKKFVDYTKDLEFIKNNILDSLENIISYYMRGTRFSIRMDKDFLITAGNSETQLTWMDAKVDGWVVTPRHGKAVEVNALWYNALKIMAFLLRSVGQESKYIEYYENIAEKVKASFKDQFWNEKGQCLYDVIDGSHKDDRIRPNQILAVSLSNAVIEGEMAERVLLKVWKELYTAYGLRSLSPKDDEYKGVYTGDRYSRDGAYHQGTVWTWLLGHFITAFLKVYGYSEKIREMALRFIKPFRDHLRDGCVGYISEIFDGSEPHIPRGCFAQAWSVAEVLRAYAEILS